MTDAERAVWADCSGCGRPFASLALEPYACSRCGEPLCARCEVLVASGTYAHAACADEESNLDATLLASFAASLLACNEGPPPWPRLADKPDPRGIVTAPEVPDAADTLFGPRIGTSAAAPNAPPSAAPSSAVPAPMANANASATVEQLDNGAEWSTLADLSTLLGGSWTVHETPPAGTQPAHVVFVEGEKGSKTPYNLRFTSASLADGGGGCGFYDELHDDRWRTGFCRGFGLRGETGSKTKVILEKSPGGQRIQIKIGSFVDAVLVRG